MSNKLRELIKCGILFLIGGCLYYCIEILWRGHSHWTMAVVGGICFLVIGGLNNYIPWEMPLWKQAGIGALFVTAMELVVGVPLNLMLGLHIWDYSSLPFNRWVKSACRLQRYGSSLRCCVFLLMIGCVTFYSMKSDRIIIGVLYVMAENAHKEKEPL